METYEHGPGEAHKHLPEIYQIEVSNACDLRCPMCLRTTDMARKSGLLNFELLRTMKERGDFAGSYYIELQMAGEPTIHPKLHKIIKFLKYDIGVMVGLSTHGLNLHKPEVRDAVLELDALTISVDSLDPELYSKMRAPAKIEDLIASLDAFFGPLGDWDEVPFTELQLVKTDMFENTGDIMSLQKLMDEKGWDRFASIRTVSDSFAEMQGRKRVDSMLRNAGICLNPFRSVSVLQNGDVVSCCFIFEPNKHSINWYGNLYENSLQEIWNSERVGRMQESQITGDMQDQCKTCYMYSPSEIHTNIVARLIQNRRGR